MDCALAYLQALDLSSDNEKIQSIQSTINGQKKVAMLKK